MRRQTAPAGAATRARHGARHQHLRRALVMEIAIGEAQAGDRSAETAVVLLVEIEARFERNALDRGADGLAADLQRVAGQPNVTDRAGAAELHRTRRTQIIENPAGAARAVKTGEREHLAGHEPASLVGVHRPGQRRRNDRPGRDGPQHKTRKHAATPTHRAGVSALWPLYPLLTILTVATLEQVGW